MKLAALALAIYAALIISALAVAQCFSYERMQNILSYQYDERLDTAYKVPGGVLLFYRSDKGTWTAVKADPDNWRSCIVATGVGLSPETFQTIGGEIGFGEN